jgi:1-aminocyclopropane-1-carboxylate deaminase/D-cysteine desulfhydrase-like pyridoxal-dependent ACC family enzyme
MPPVEVLAVPCVSSAEHLQAQIDQLHRIDSGGALGPSARPTILSTQRAPRRMFAKPYAAHWQIWRALKAESGIEFDLIYAPRAFEVLLSQCDAFDTSTATDSGSVTSNKTASLERWMEGCNIMYYHCGGVEGNESQLQRYRKIHT